MRPLGLDSNPGPAALLDGSANRSATKCNISRKMLFFPKDFFSRFFSNHDCVILNWNVRKKLCTSSRLLTPVTLSRWEKALPSRGRG